MARNGYLDKAKGWYLFVYNLAMFVVHFFLFQDLVQESRKGSFDYATHFKPFRTATLLQLVDVVHGHLGLTGTSPITGLIQVLGRLLMLQLLAEVRPYHHNHVLLALLFAYVLIELVRYPYYAFRALNYDWWPFTWMRYNAWIILQPIGFTAEFICLGICAYSQHHKQTFSKYCCACIKDKPYIITGIFAVFMLTAFPYIAYTLISHMAHQRRKKYGVLYTQRSLNNFIQRFNIFAYFRKLKGN